MSFGELGTAAAGVQQAAVNHVFQHREQDAAYARYSGPEGYYAEVIPPLFAPWIDMPDPAAYQPLIQDLTTAMGKLAFGEGNTDPRDAKFSYAANLDLSVIKSASDNLEGWLGRGADAFKHGFLDKLQPLMHNHFMLIGATKAALEGHQEMWRQARIDILNLANATIEALEYDSCCNGSASWSFDFTVLTAAIAVAGVVLDVATDGLAVPVTAPITLSIVGNAAQVAAAAPPKGEAVKTAMQIIAKMEQSITKLHDSLTDAERMIATALTDDGQAVHDGLKLYDGAAVFILKRPDLADANASNVTSNAYMGDHKS